MKKSNEKLLPPEQLYGEFYLDVQQAGLFKDSKQFSDSVALYPAEVILEKYFSSNQDAGFSLEAFIHEHFNLPKDPTSVYESDPNKDIIQHITELWPYLTRSADSYESGSSRIPLPYDYVVPGGRFNEIYYWDSYFTMLGLAKSGKSGLIHSMIQNFAYMIERFGFIPNGNRTYFLSRSQPPFYSLMLRLLEETSQAENVLPFVDSLEKEYSFWMSGEKSLNIGHAERRVFKKEDGVTLNRYYDSNTTPRGEMYRDDMLLAKKSLRDSGELIQDIRAACESGWDFSCRWFDDIKNLESIQTTKILPVDLNCLLYHYEEYLSNLFVKQGSPKRALMYEERAQVRKESIINDFWNEDSSFFEDIYWKSMKPTGKKTLAGMYPMFMNLATADQAEKCAAQIEMTFLKEGGVRTTPYRSGQQWDAPNGWAPLQWISVKGLKNYGYHQLAKEVSDRWIALNKRVYRDTGKMLEKYNVEDVTLLGGGGEYEVQDGFGWTNGVYLQLAL